MAEIKRRSEAFSRVGSPQRMMAMNASDNTRLADLRIAEVKPDPGNPRKEFDETELADLAASLKKHGLLQPIVVRKIEDDFIILAGERRWRAAQIAGFISIKAIIHSDNRTAANILVAQIIENEQRASLSPAELVSSIGRLLAEGLGVTDIATELSMNRTRVSKLKALTELPSELQPFLETMGIDPLYELLQQHKADAGSVQTTLASGKAPTRAEVRETKRESKTPRGSLTSDKPDDPLQKNAFAGERRSGADKGAIAPKEDAFAGERASQADDAAIASNGKAFAGERHAPAEAETPVPVYRDQGSIIVSHNDYGEGRVVFNIAAEGDRLPVLFGTSPDPIPTLLAELTIVAMK